MDLGTVLKKENLLLLLFGGLLLLVVAMPTGKNKDAEKEQTAYAQVKTTDAITDLEEELSGLLSKVEGAGTCEAMLMGKILEDGSVQVDGVVVLSDGARNGEVVLSLTDAVRALFGIEAHKVKVLTQNRG